MKYQYFDTHARGNVSLSSYDKTLHIEVVNALININSKLDKIIELLSGSKDTKINEVKMSINNDISETIQKQKTTILEIKSNGEMKISNPVKKSLKRRTVKK